MISNKKNRYTNFENLFPYFMETVEDLIIIVSFDKSLEIEHVYKCKFLEQLGYSNNILIGKSLLDLVDFGDVIRKEDIKKTIQQNKSRQEIKVIDKHGHFIWAELNSTPFNDDKNQQKLIVTLRNISKRKKLELKLEELECRFKGTSEEKYRHLYESSPNAILLINIKGEVIDCNLISEKLSGFKKSELIGMNFMDTLFIPEEYIPSILEDFKVLFQEKVIEPREIQLYTKEGMRKWILYQASIFKIENEEIIQVIIQNIDDKNKAEQKIKESEAKYHELFETSPDGVILTDIKGKILECNSALEQISGYSTRDFIGKNFRKLEIYHENGLNILLKGYKDLLGEKPLAAVEFPIKSKFNQIKWVEVRSKLINMKGQHYILAVIHDTTTQKQAEKALKESEEKFRDLLETSSVGVMELDVINKKLTYINPKLLDIIGYNKKELTEELFRHKIIHPQDVSKLLRTYEELELEFRIIDKMGKLKWLSGKRIPNYNENGEISSIRVWLDDITEKKMYEELIFELNINFLNFTADIQKNLQLLLTTCLKLLNGELILYYQKNLSDSRELYQVVSSDNKTYSYDFGDLSEGHFINELFSEDHDFPQIFMDIDKMNYAKSDPFIIDHKFKGCFGKLIKSHSGFTSAVCVFFKNNRVISGQDKLILFLICDAIEIEQRRWKVQQDLEEQNITLNKINKLKTELFSRTSHELKTPLISIKGFTELLLTLHKNKLDTETISILEEIKDGSKRLEKIINLLLESTKLEAGQLELNKSKEDLTFLINFCVKELKGLAKLRNQTILFDADNKVEAVFDKERIYEVISNLLLNALKYTPPGGTISIQIQNDQDSHIVSIKDNGIGFTKEEMRKVFKQFGKIERYGQGWDVAIEGTGLGLYITKKIVELHDGEIWLESEGRNKGSTFYFSIPKK